MKAKKYPWLLIIVIFAVAGCATKHSHWQKTVSENTAEAYEEFLEKYPESSYAEKAKDKIMELRYNEAVKADTIQAYQNFLESYPESRFTEDVLSRLDRHKHQERIKALNSVKRVRVAVIQSYEKAAELNLPFEDWTRKLLEYAGRKALEAEARHYDMAITIRAKGKPLGAVYSLERYEYSGASLSGSISIELPNLPPDTEIFESTINPPDKIGSIHFNASDAPYWEAFRADGSFLPKIFEIMGDYFGNQPLVEAIKDGSLNIKFMPAVSLENIKNSLEIKQLIAALEDKEFGSNIADALVKIGKPAVKPLISALQDENKEVRKNAARALGEIKDRRAVRPLIAALDEEDEDFREIVTEALGRIQDPRAIETLIFILGNKEEDENSRWKAAAALGRIKDPRSVEPLITALGDKSRAIRGVAAAALGEIKDNRALEPLINTLRDKDKSIRRNTSVALKKITGEDFGEDYKRWKKWWKKKETDSSNQK